MIDRYFQALAVILAGVAAFLWWRDNNDWAFASGVCAAASFFIAMRFQIKARLNAAGAEREQPTAAEAEDLIDKE